MAHMMMVLVASLAIALGVFFTEEIVDAVSRVEITAFGQATAQSETTESMAAGGEAGKNSPAPKTGEGADNAATSTGAQTSGTAGSDQENEGYISELANRKRQLDERESELKKMEEELHRYKNELENKMKELEDMRKNISSILEDRVARDNERIDKLVSVYSNMKAATAAKVFEKLDEDLATEILGRMKKQNAAAILNKLSSKKAQKLSEKYAGYLAR